MTMYVITHKHFDYKNLPEGYEPILVGSNKNPNPDGFMQDNQGDNISNKNDSYCELTGLYWFWKHGQEKYVGLSHYRRFFADYSSRKRMYLHELVNGSVAPIEVNKLNGFLESGYQFVASQPEAGGPGTLWQQFDRNHHIKDMMILENVIKTNYPDYITAFENVMKHNNVGSFFNMFYTSRHLMSEYCEWLFDVLSKVEKKTDISSYDTYQKRLYGFFAERLMNVWIKKNGIKVKYLPVYQSDEVSRKHVIKLIKERFIY